MPEESGHRLEAGLRAWAKHRREQAGKEFELHPATRRLLRDEVRRAFPPRETGPGPATWTLSQFWSRAVNVLGVFLILGLAGLAGKVVWNNLPRYGDAALDDANPPQQFAFSLRRSSDSEQEKSGLITNQTSVDKSDPDAMIKAKASSVEALAAGAKAVSLAARPSATPSGQVAASPKEIGTVENPFAIGSSASVPDAALSYKPSTASTGGLAALVGSVDRRSRADSSGAEQSLGVVRAQPPPAAPAATAPPSRLAEATTAERKGGDTPVLASAVRAKAGGSAGQEDLSRSLASVSVKSEVESGRSLALGDSSRGVGGSNVAPAPTQTAVFQDSLAQSATVRSEAARERPASAAANPALTRYVRESAGTTVLENFTVQMEGEEVTLVDADGSVYRGRITDSNPMTLNRSTPARSAGGRSAVPSLSYFQATPNEETHAGSSDLYFQVSGTNRSLGQAVQLSGVFGRDASPPRDTTGRQLRTSETTRLSAPVMANGSAAPPAPGPTNTSFVRAMLRLGTNQPQFFRAVRSP